LLSWYALFPDVPNSLTNLRITYSGFNSASCRQRLSLWNWSTATWVTVDSRIVGANEVLITATPTGTLSQYVSGLSGEGDLYVRVSCSRGDNTTFYSSADQLKISYQE
jgi:hypothetical protein